MIARHLFACTVLMLCVLALRALFGRRLSARARYALWLLVLIRLCCPITLGQSRASVQRIIAPRPSVQVWVEAPASSLPVVQSAPAASPERAGATTASLPIIPLLYALGAASVGACLLTSNLRFAVRLLRSRRRIRVPGCPLRVYATGLVDAPCLFGLCPPSIYLPAALSCSRRSLRHMLAHEVCHARHLDFFWALCRCLLLCAYWFHPLVWLCARLSAQDAECACDESAIALLGKKHRRAYAHTLLMQLARPARRTASCLATAWKGDFHAMKRRFTQLIHHPRTLRRTACALTALLLLVCLGTFTGAPLAESLSEIPASSTPLPMVSSTSVPAKESLPPAVPDTAILLLAEAPADGSVSLKVTPSWLGSQAYFAPHDEALDALFASLSEGTAPAPDWRKSKRDAGFSLCDGPRELAAFTDGALIETLADGTERLYQADELFARACGLLSERLHYGAVDPAGLTGLSAASLYRSGAEEARLTDPAALSRLETLLTGARSITQPACPFGPATLSLTLSSGEVVVLSLATDGCPIFLTDGTYYQAQGDLAACFS